MLSADGAASDPYKLAALRAMQRVRTACLHSPEDPGCEMTGPMRAKFDNLLLMLSKHTWGRGLGAESVNTSWDNKAFDLARESQDRSLDTSFAAAERAWDERKRACELQLGCGGGDILRFKM